MISYPEFNIFAVIIGFIINSALGFVWYSDKSPTGQYWMKEMGYDDATELEPDPKLFGLSFFFNLITVWGLAILVPWSGASNFLEGMLAGLFGWWAFMFATSFNTVAFEERKITVWLLYGIYQLIIFVLLGGMFAVWT